MGARNGWNIAVTAVIPSVVMAFVCMQILNFTGIINIIDFIFQPVTMLVGLPGKAATPLLFCVLSVTGALGMVASMAAEGDLSPEHVAMLVAALMLMGAQLTYMARVLGTSGIKTKYYPLLFGIGYFDGILALVLMRLLLL